MSGLEERRKAWQKKFETDSQFKFTVMIGRDKLLARWAAAKMSMSEEETQEYIRSVVRADLEEAGDDDVVRKVMADFKEKGVGITEAELREQLKVFQTEAGHKAHEE